MGEDIRVREENGGRLAVRRHMHQTPRLIHEADTGPLNIGGEVTLEGREKCSDASFWVRQKVFGLEPTSLLGSKICSDGCQK
jgi:hypothetical protein